tara:strand:- start:401 stop:937 length:537 start_codon:yes stop_codon:yes gene_type:complete
MPTATQFTALGAGNGLASCAYRKTFNAATHSGLYTLEEIMKLYWNTSSIQVSATSLYGLTVSDTLNYTTEPQERVCNSDGASQPFRLVGDDGYIPEEDEAYIGFDTSTSKYFLNIPEIIFQGFFGNEGVIKSGNDNFAGGSGGVATDSSGVGKTWSIEGGGPPTTASATIEFNFYTYS